MTHTHYKLLFHLVWSTKGRLPFISPFVKDRLYAYIRAPVTDQDGSILAMNGMPDHIHILVSLTPKASLPDLIRRIKTETSKWLRREIPLCQTFAWQEGYGAFTVGHANKEAVIKYIQLQEEHHHHTSYDKEYLNLLNLQKISFDPRFVLG